MRRLVRLVLVAALIWLPAAAASAGRPPPQRWPWTVDTPTYPACVGYAVGPRGHAHWPVRIRSLDEIHWTWTEGRHVGMAAPLEDGLLFAQAGGGSIRGIEAGTGKRSWLRAGHTKYWNYSTCVLGPGGVAYGGNYDFLQAVDRRGRRLWQTPLQCRWIHMPPAVSPDGKTVYVGGDGLGIAALNAANGHVNWMRRDFRSPDNSYVFDATGRLIVATRAGVLCFTDRGRELWTLERRFNRLMLVGDLLLGIDKGGLHALDVEKRTPVWDFAPGPQVVDMAYGDDGRIVVTLDSGELACLDRTGRKRWQRKLAPVALHRPVTARGGETLVGDMDGRLVLCDSNGHVISRIETGDHPFRWRPTVGADGRVYLGHQDDRLVCVGGREREAPKPVVAHTLTVVADDFVVDAWVNGEKLPLDAREMVGERHGAMTERMHVDLRAGDWIVFNVVANRLRWNGASYFGVHAVGPGEEMAFVSTTAGGWSACDDPAHVLAFIAERDAGRERGVSSPTNPWGDAPGIWRDVLGHEFTGEPVWGTAPGTWIKYVVPAAARPLRPEDAVDSVRPRIVEPHSSETYWRGLLDRLEPGMTPAQVKAIVPPWPEGGGEGGSYEGSGYVLTYRVSARWLVRIGFGYEQGHFGTPGLLDIAAPENGERLTCLVTERLTDVGEVEKTLGEILLGTDGQYAWTRYGRRAASAAGHESFQGALPEALNERLTASLRKGHTYVYWHDDLKVERPDGVQDLLDYLEKTHPLRQSQPDSAD